MLLGRDVVVSANAEVSALGAALMGFTRLGWDLPAPEGGAGRRPAPGGRDAKTAESRGSLRARSTGWRERSSQSAISAPRSPRTIRSPPDQSFRRRSRAPRHGRPGGRCQALFRHL